MAGLVNYASVELRASTVDGGPNGQSAAFTISETASEAWLEVPKTAENNPDNLLTVRLQAKIGTIWVDVPVRRQTTAATATAADIALPAAFPNIVEASSQATFRVLARLEYIPSNVLRVAFVSSGTGSGGVDTGTMSTFSANLRYREKEYNK